jgi:DNA-binding NtrC family response regulator
MSGTPLKVLIVDDNATAADAMARNLQRGGDEVTAVHDGRSAIDWLQRNQPDVVLTDLKMEPVDGLQVLEAARAQRPPIEVVVFTAFGDVEVAVEAMRLGARDFLTKPVSVAQIEARLDSLRPPSHTPSPVRRGPRAGPFVARSPAASRMLELLRTAADVPSPCWIEGELGAGRGHAALALHRMGNPDLPFQTRDLGRDDPWPTEGTVLLPNLDDLALDLQRQLHRSLSRVPPGVRLVATSGPDARRKVAEGTLLAEIYYGLAVVVVRMPALRERTEDILPMFDQALDSFAERYKRPRPQLTDAQRRGLTSHAWPGNVRELVNLAERTVVMGGGALDIQVTPTTAAGLPRLEPGFSLSNHLESVEKAILEEAMRITGGDRPQMGTILGLERNTLRYKLKKYDLLD